MSDVDAATETMLGEMYSAFNDRAIEAVLERMTEDVEWPNGWEGGYVHGRDQVRDYWTRQWAEIDPSVTPTAITAEPDSRIRVTVHQIIRDHAGTILADAQVHHIYTLQANRIARMEIVD